MTESGTEVPDRLLEYMRARTEPDGWRVEADARRGVATSFTFVHALSTEAGCAVDAGQPEAEVRAFVDRFLQKREFGVIGQRPTETPHAPLMQSFRRTAQANGWSTDVLAMVARILRNHELLTPAEAEWLEDAGPAWGAP